MGNFLDKDGVSLLWDKSKKLVGTGVSRTDKKNFGLVWIYYTRNLMRAYTDIETAARAYAQHDLIVTQILQLNDYAPVYGSSDASAYDYNENSKKIIKRAKELNPHLKRVEYIQSESVRGDFKYNGESAHLNSDGTWEGSTADLSGCTKIYTLNQFIDWFKHFKYVGTDGVFFDDWGYDSSIDYICYQMGYNPDDFSDLNSCLNKKWSDLIDYAHQEGLFVITNGGWQPGVGDWYTHLTEDDIICLESNMITSDGGKIYNGQKSIYSYYDNYHKNGKCLAKVWSLNYFPPDCTGTFLEKVNTYILNMALAAGADYVSVGVAYENYLPDYFSDLVYGNKTITKLSDYIYRISINDHSLEVQKDSLITGVLTENMINQCYSIYDGAVFQNAYITPRCIDKNFGDRIASLEDAIENATADIKSNAMSYLRMKIDDWQVKSVYEAYTNLAEDDYFPDENECVKGNIDDFTITYDTAGWHGCGLFSIIFSDEQYSSLRGKEIEFGVMYLDIKMADNATAPKASMKLVTESDGTKYKSLPSASAVSILTDNTQGWCYRMTVPTDCMSMSVQIWDAWLNASNAGVMHGEKGYCILVDELDEEISKTWYTNLGKHKFDKISNAVFTQTERMYRNKPLYDIEGHFTETNGYVIYQFSNEDLIALRGHTLEIGCQEITASDGSLLDGQQSSIQFGIGGMMASAAAIPNNVNAGQMNQNKSIDSAVWDKGEFPYAFKATIPDGYLNLGIVLRSLTHAANTTIQLKGVYIYDLGEEDIHARGKESAKTSLSLCRVSEEIEKEDPNVIKNALYISDKGRMWIVNAAGEQTDIASVKFTPALTSGVLIGTLSINGEEHSLYAPSDT